MNASILARIVDGRTDLVLEHLKSGGAATARDAGGVPLIAWCGYYGDVTAVRALLDHGESLTALGEDFDLHGAAFHGHWQLCQFLLEHGADGKHARAGTGETPLHAATAKHFGARSTNVVQVLLAAGADPNARTAPGVETGAFMRDCRTRGETPLHRAAAFAPPELIELLLRAGGHLDVRDANGDTPLSWASWHGRPAPVLRMLCHGPFKVHPSYAGLESNLAGRPHPAGDR